MEKNNNLLESHMNITYNQLLETTACNHEDLIGQVQQPAAPTKEALQCPMASWSASEA